MTLHDLLNEYYWARWKDDTLYIVDRPYQKRAQEIERLLERIINETQQDAQLGSVQGQSD